MISESQEFESQKKQKLPKFSEPKAIAIIDRRSGKRSKIKSNLRESKSQSAK